MVNDGTGLDDVTWNDLSMNDVFQRAAQCDTSPGEEILYWRLRRNRMSPEEQQIFEERVRTWADNEKEREKIEELLCDIGKSDSSYYLPAYLDGIESYIFGNQWVYRVLQILLAAAFIFLLIRPTDGGVMPFVCMCAVNLGIYFWMNMKHDLELSLIGTAVSLLGNAKQIAVRKGIKELFPELQDALAGLKGVIRGERILRIKREGACTGDALGTCLDYLLGITLMQITTYNKVMKRLMNNVENYLTVYRCIGELDAAISTASFRKSLPWCCIPEYTDEKKLEMTEVYHPLIKEPVANDFAVEKSCLITGSNASGKSTFIKAVAVNAVLAQAMNTCAAKRFVIVGFDALCHCMEAYTSKNAQPFTDALCEYAMRLTAENLVRVYKGQGDTPAWEKLTLASTIGGMVLNTAGVTLAHGMEHPASGDCQDL